jgi:hypothetical protein
MPPGNFWSPSPHRCAHFACSLYVFCCTCQGKCWCERWQPECSLYILCCTVGPRCTAALCSSRKAAVLRDRRYCDRRYSEASLYITRRMLVRVLAMQAIAKIKIALLNMRLGFRFWLVTRSAPVHTAEEIYWSEGVLQDTCTH